VHGSLKRQGLDQLCKFFAMLLINLQLALQCGYLGILIVIAPRTEGVRRIFYQIVARLNRLSL
jgi:hypothetical protein